MADETKAPRKTPIPELRLIPCLEPPNILAVELWRGERKVQTWKFKERTEALEALSELTGTQLIRYIEDMGDRF